MVQQKVATRDKLIDSAMTLFRENGYEATSVKDVLKHAGVNSGSMYYFFPKKDDLLLAVLENYKTLLWPIVLDPVFARVSDPVERIFGVLAGYRQMLISTDFLMGCPIGNLALELCAKNESARKLLAENFESWRLAIRGCLEDAALLLPAEIDCDKFATFILTVMEGSIMQARTYRTIEPFDTCVVVVRDYVDRLLRDSQMTNTQ